MTIGTKGIKSCKIGEVFVLVYRNGEVFASHWTETWQIMGMISRSFQRDAKFRIIVEIG